MICNTGSRGLFQLRNNAQGVPVVFMLVPQKKKTIQCQEDNCGSEEGRDREKC